MIGWNYRWTAGDSNNPETAQFLFYSRTRWDEMSDGMPRPTVEILALLKYRPSLLAWDAFLLDGEGPFFRSESLVEVIKIIEEHYKREGDGR